MKPKTRKLTEFELGAIKETFYDIHAETQWTHQNQADKLYEDLLNTKEIWIVIDGETS